MSKLKKYTFRHISNVDYVRTPFLDWMNELVPSGITNNGHLSIADIELVLRDPRFTKIVSTNEYPTSFMSPLPFLDPFTDEEYAWARTQPDIIPQICANLYCSKKYVRKIYQFIFDSPMKMIDYQKIANQLAFIRNRIIYKNPERTRIGIHSVTIESFNYATICRIRYIFMDPVLTLFDLVKLYTKYRMHDYIYQSHLSPDGKCMQRYFETDDDSDLPKPSVFLNEILNKRKSI